MPDFSNIRATVEPDHRIIAVGDVHGRLDLLKAILRSVSALDDAADATTSAVFLGDFIDRGDDSRGVLAVLAEIKEAWGGRAKFLIGNHEEMMLAFLEGRTNGQLWMANGGWQTLASFGLPPIDANASSAKLEDARGALMDKLGVLRQFLKDLTLSWQHGDFFFCHAGLDPALSLHEQRSETMVWGHPAFCDVQRQDKICVVHGHYVTSDVVATPSRIGVDTGAYFSGNLSAVVLEPDAFSVISSTR